MLTVLQGKLMAYECGMAFKAVLQKVNGATQNAHAQFVMSNCKIALRYLEAIYTLGTDGFAPIAFSLCRTYYEIVCSTMYLAEHKNELDDFLKFGRLLHYETAEDQNLSGTFKLVSDHKELRQYFKKKKKLFGTQHQQLSWHGMNIIELAKAVGIEKFIDQASVFTKRRYHYTRTSKLDGDSLVAMLAYNLDHFGMKPTPFAPPMEDFRSEALILACPLFIVLLAVVGIGLNIDLTKELKPLTNSGQCFGTTCGRRIQLESVTLTH